MIFEIKIGDETKELRYTNYALCELEDKLEGIPALVIMQDSYKLQSMKVLSTLIWAGLLEDHKYSFEEVVRMIDPINFAKYLGTATLAIAFALNGPPSKKPKSEKGGGKK